MSICTSVIGRFLNWLIVKRTRNEYIGKKFFSLLYKKKKLIYTRIIEYPPTFCTGLMGLRTEFCREAFV